MRRMLAALGLALGAAGPALAQPQPVVQLPPNAVVISPGERVEMTIGPAGEPLVGVRGPMPEADAAALPVLDNAYERVQQVHAPSSAPTPGRLVFELVSDPQHGARLKVLNGYDQAVIYTADMVLGRGGVRRYVSTSICPVAPGRGGFESWANDLAGLAITGVQRVDAAHMACNNGSELAVAPQPASDRYACSGGERGASLLPPFSVTLVVDAQGRASGQSASWVLSRPDILHSPLIGFDFAMEGDRVTPGARAARVMAVVALRPPPSAKAADIVLLWGGAEVARRPWRMYAQNLAQLPPDPASRPVAFTGVIPFVPTTDASDDGLRRLLGTIGQQPGSIEVKVLGDDGSVIADGSYDVGQSPIRDPAVVDSALQQAQAAARTPTQCRKITR